MLIWTSVISTLLLPVAFIIKSVRESVIRIARMVFSRPLSLLWGTTLIYVALVFFFLSRFNFWTDSLVKIGFFWFFGSFPLLFKINSILEQGLVFFKNIVFESIGLVVVLEFIANLYVFSFSVEFFILVPLASVIAFLKFKYKYNEENQSLTGYLNLLLSCIALFILTTSIFHIAYNPKKYLQLKTLYQFVFPVGLTFSVLPFLYAAGVYVGYDSLFANVRAKNGVDRIPFSIKWGLFAHCHVNLTELKKVREEKAGKLNVNSLEELRESLQEKKEEKKPRTEREKIYWELVRAEDKAQVEAAIMYPTDIQHITSGFSFQSERRVVIDDGPVPPGCKIEIIDRWNDGESISSNFYAKAFDKANNLIAEGELVGTWLQNQGLNLIERNLNSNTEEQRKLHEQYKNEVIKKYKLDETEVEEILTEGIDNSYPTPEPVTIDEYI